MNTDELDQRKLNFRENTKNIINKTKVIRADLLDFDFDLDFEDIIRLGNISVLDPSIWTSLFGPVCLDSSFWTRLFVPVYLDPFIWIRLFRPGYLDLTIWTPLFGPVYLEPSV